MNEYNNYVIIINIQFNGIERIVFYLPNDLDLIISLISLEDAGEL